MIHQIYLVRWKESGAYTTFKFYKLERAKKLYNEIKDWNKKHRRVKELNLWQKVI